MAKIAVNDIEVNYELQGPDDAPWLVCLHSLATDLRVWDLHVDRFSRTHRVLRPDLRGHGSTPPTDPPYTLELLVDDTVALLDALAIERVDLVGLSIGGLISMGMAINHADRVNRVVVADARADAPDAYAAIWDGVIATARAEGLEPIVDSSLERWFSAEFRAGDPPIVQALRSQALETSLDGLIGCARAVQGLAYLPDLHRIGAPTLFVVGENDPAAPVDVMRDMASRVEGSAFEVIPGAGHLTPLEAPDEFGRVVTAFLLADRG